jgi:catechol 2,3-dioxygenase-like lactoylglutathione lyase family enzyme
VSSEDRPPPPWSIRSILVAVRDLGRSSAFYRDVMELDEVAHEGEVIILGKAGSLRDALLLRQADRQAIHHGPSELGARAVCFEVPSGELDRIQGRLKSLHAFHDRRQLDQAELVRGHDPDGLPIVFYAGPSPEDMSP